MSKLCSRHPVLLEFVLFKTATVLRRIGTTVLRSMTPLKVKNIKVVKETKRTATKMYFKLQRDYESIFQKPVYKLEGHGFHPPR